MTAPLRRERMRFCGRMAMAKYYGLTVDGNGENFTVGLLRLDVQVSTQEGHWWVYAASEEQGPAQTPYLTADQYVFALLEGGTESRTLVTLCGVLDRQRLTGGSLERRETDYERAGWYYRVEATTLAPLPKEW